MDKEIINVSEGTSEKAPISYYHILLALIAGMVLGAFLLMTVLAGIRDQNKYDYLIGGWIVAGDETGNEPHSFAFYENYVDVGFEGEDLIRCTYSVKEEGLNSIITIYNCKGSDLTFTHSTQMMLRTGGDIKAIYHASG